ncbi:hypothetical protein phytr_12860 [Candidatus Phycorickettsia trachydisci]|uniref:Uncharacterized protein n=1 Tax=Candidatus Phycorickettsia trachydisci TaxID=2115978 RepID=A0A2P1PAC8_9RICK|nr:hypothetical protein phytr_12860 [Candidatus Phycorickettsia trachydisci]
MSRILLDMNYPAFQQSLFGLEKVEQRAILNTLKKNLAIKLGSLIHR